MIGLISGVDVTAPPTSLMVETRPWDELATSFSPQAILSILLIGGIALATIGMGRWNLQGFVPLVAALGLAACAGGPMMLLIGAALALIGWMTAQG
jgi:hypothetical protein